MESYLTIKVHDEARRKEQSLQKTRDRTLLGEMEKQSFINKQHAFVTVWSFQYFGRFEGPRKGDMGRYFLLVFKEPISLLHLKKRLGTIFGGIDAEEKRSGL